MKRACILLLLLAGCRAIVTAIEWNDTHRFDNVERKPLIDPERVEKWEVSGTP